MKFIERGLFFVCIAITLTSCDYWPSHYFYIQNAIPDSEIRIEFDNVDDYKYTEEENLVKVYTLSSGQKKLMRIVGSANTGLKNPVENVFDEFGTYPETLPFTLYVNDVKVDKVLYTKENWQFTSYEGHGDYLLVITEDLIGNLEIELDEKSL